MWFFLFFIVSLLHSACKVNSFLSYAPEFALNLLFYDQKVQNCHNSSTLICISKWNLLLILFQWSHGCNVLSCRCYIKLHDSPPTSATKEDNVMSKLPPSQKKKMRQKQRKAEARAKKVLVISITSVTSSWKSIHAIVLFSF